MGLDIRRTIDEQVSPDGLQTGGGSGGTSNYTDLENKPQINGVTLTGNKSASDLSMYTQSEVSSMLASLSSSQSTVDSTQTSEIGSLSTAASELASESAAMSESIAGKQDSLTAGNNITIENNVISSSSTSVDGTTIQYNQAGVLECVGIVSESVSYTAGASETRRSMVYNLASLVDFTKLSLRSYIKLGNSKNYRIITANDTVDEFTALTLEPGGTTTFYITAILANTTDSSACAYYQYTFNAGSNMSVTDYSTNTVTEGETWTLYYQ